MNHRREGHDFFCVCVYCQGKPREEETETETEAIERTLAECTPEQLEAVNVGLDEYLDAHPCKLCGGHYDIHNYLTEPEMAEAREQGCTVRICESVGERVLGRGETFFCVVTPLPDNPCNESFMEDIST